MRDPETSVAEEMTAHASPPIEGHRVLGDGRTIALLDHEATIDWWCDRVPHGEPLLWSLLDPEGGSSRFVGVDAPLEAVDLLVGPLAAPVLDTSLVAGGRLHLRDALFPCATGGSTLVRSVRALDRPVTLRHELRLGGWGTGTLPRRERGGVEIAGRRWQLHVFGAEVQDQGGDLVALLELDPDRAPATIVLTADPAFDLRADSLLSRIESAAEAADIAGHHGRSPSGPARRLADGLDVLRACTYAPTGAIVAAPTTSLPEAPGADRQFDYRYTWLRDGSLGAAVTAVAGESDVAEGHLEFLELLGPDRVLASPLWTVEAEPVPDEREVLHVAGWERSLPVRTGNDASGQVQYDALGFVVEAISIVAREGGGLSDELWALVVAIAERVLASPPGPTSGIWELREPRTLVDADIGVWMALDHAVRLGDGHRGGAPTRWRVGRDAARGRVRSAALPDGMLPQARPIPGSDPPRPDASALLAVICGLIEPEDPLAETVVDRCLETLGTGPHLHRYPPGEDDGFHGTEATFVPCSFWTVTALATIGRREEAWARFEELDASLPRLLAEQWDPGTCRSLGNAPLSWSHIEAIRALYAIDGSITA